MTGTREPQAEAQQTEEKKPPRLGAQAMVQQNELAPETKRPGLG
jgi:hypothetical protein